MATWNGRGAFAALVGALSLAGASLATAATDRGEPAQAVGAGEDLTWARGAAPGRGTIHDLVVAMPAGPTITARDGVAALPGGVRVELLGAVPVFLKAIGPGETSGAGVALTVAVVNGSSAAIDLSSASVTLTYAGERKVASPATGGAYAPLAGFLDSDARVTGTYVYRLPPNEQKKAFTATVTYAPGRPVALFRGVAK